MMILGCKDMENENGIYCEECGWEGDIDEAYMEFDEEEESETEPEYLCPDCRSSNLRNK